MSNVFFAEVNDAIIGGQAAMGMNYFAFFPGLENEYWQHKHECIRVTYAQDEAVVHEGVKVIADEVKKLYG